MFLDSERQRLDRDTCLSRHSEYEQQFQAAVQEAETSRRLDGRVQRPRCGDRFTQLASHLRYCDGSRQEPWLVRRREFKTCPACGLRRADLRSHQRFCNGQTIAPAQIVDAQSRITHITWRQSHHTRCQTPASAIAVTRVSLFRKHLWSDHEPHVEVPVPPPPDPCAAARLRRLR